MDSGLLTVAEASAWLRISVSWLNKARLTETGPSFVRVGRAVRYRRADLEAYAAGLTPSGESLNGGSSAAGAGLSPAELGS